MAKAAFLCELPPPYGGVTVKNQLILDAVVKTTDSVKIIDFCEIKRNPIKILPVFVKMLQAFSSKDNKIVYGFGSHKRLKLALRIQKLLGGKASLSKTVNIVMGGRFQEFIQADRKLLELLSAVELHLVETERMRNEFVLLGLKNTSVFPNARRSIGAKEPTVPGGPLKLVFFSRIIEDKGVDYILSELAGVDGITVDFYGPIDSGIKAAFDQFIAKYSYAHYRGVFDAAKDDVYAELNQYDVLLLPTKHKTEGVPGILVEAKMAGITAIVSDLSHNAEIVADNSEGIVINDLEKGTLLAAIKSLENNRDRLTDLKQGAYRSRYRYAMETYIPQMRGFFGLEE